MGNIARAAHLSQKGRVRSGPFSSLGHTGRSLPVSQQKILGDRRRKQVIRQCQKIGPTKCLNHPIAIGSFPASLFEHEFGVLETANHHFFWDAAPAITIFDAMTSLITSISAFTRSCGFLLPFNIYGRYRGCPKRTKFS